MSDKKAGYFDNLKSIKSKAVAYKEGKPKTVLTVTTDMVYADEQVRTVFDEAEIANLAETMEKDGQLVPIRVFPADDDGRYKIEHGERRWRAAKLKSMPIDIIVSKDVIDADTLMMRQLLENVQRAELQPLETAVSLNKAIKNGFKQADLVKRLGKSQPWISSHISLNPEKLPACILSIYDAKYVRDYEALNNLRKLYKIDAQICEDLCSYAAESGGLTRKESAKALRDAKNPPKSELITGEAISSVDKPSESVDDAGIEYAFDVDSAKPGMGKQHANSSVNQESDTQEPTDSSDSFSSNPWKKRDAKRASIIVNITTTSGIKRGKLILDRLDENPEYMWVGMSGELPNTYEYIRCHVSEIDILKVVN